MDELVKIETYYKGEQNEAFVMLIAGIIIGCISICIWKVSTSHSFSRGMFIPLLVLSLFCFGAGLFNYYNNGKRIVDKTALYKQSREAFFEEEIPKMQNMKSWWTPLRITWTAMLVIGVIIIFSTDTYFWQGVAVGIIIFGAAGHVIDGVAYERNESYTVYLLNQN